MLPYKPEVFSTQISPAAVIADKAGVETIDSGRGNNLGGTTGAEGANHMGNESGLEDFQVVSNRSATDFAWPRKSRCLENPAALRKQQLGEPLERIASLQPKQFLDVLRPIGVHPFLKVTLGQFAGEKKRRQPAPQETAPQITGMSEILHVFETHWRQPNIPFATGEGVTEFG